MPIEYVIKEDGGVYKRTLAVDHPIDIMPTIAQVFQSSAMFKLDAMFNLTDFDEPFFGNVAITTSLDNPNNFWASVRVKSLNLNTTFDLIDGVLTPRFLEGGTRLEIPWRMPETMKLVLGMMVVNYGDDGYKLGKHYLVAYDSANRTWRLPIANLYETLELCHGQQPGYHPTLGKAVLVGAQTFRSSQWNRDLSSIHSQDHTKQMFRFKPLNTGFEQLPILPTPAEWTTLCHKVGGGEIVTSKLIPVS